MGTDVLGPVCWDLPVVAWSQVPSMARRARLSSMSATSSTPAGALRGLLPPFLTLLPGESNDVPGAVLLLPPLAPAAVRVLSKEPLGDPPLRGMYVSVARTALYAVVLRSIQSGAPDSALCDEEGFGTCQARQELETKCIESCRTLFGRRGRGGCRCSP